MLACQVLNHYEGQKLSSWTSRDNQIANSLQVTLKALLNLQSHVSSDLLASWS